MAFFSLCMQPATTTGYYDTNLYDVHADATEPTMHPAAAQMLAILATSEALRGMPDVRKLALHEALRCARTPEAVMSIAADNVCDSPFVPADQRDGLAELMLTGDFDTLRRALQCSALNGQPSSHARHWALALAQGANSEFETYRAMVVAIFSRSRKIAALPAERRRALGAAIHATTSKAELKDLALRSLETSPAFEGYEREMVANDILDDRYDLLLRPGSFDCEERAPRLMLSAERARKCVHPASPASPASTAEPLAAEECPVCLGENCVELALPCKHAFCRSCATSWLSRCRSCPMCRAPATLQQCRPAERP